ncbi:hypothetical protein [Amycolatopsis sulphurea]|uniref:hypothetical protein n=1 Tax=Amycolatopsis sulphurea TaxID=76022 RepID=UPI0014758A55|nr:hypothetical protein [Amycolatopsis sulphurea]
MSIRTMVAAGDCVVRGWVSVVTDGGILRSSWLLAGTVVVVGCSAADLRRELRRNVRAGSGWVTMSIPGGPW